MGDDKSVSGVGTEQSIKSLGDWLEKVEAIGEVKHISAEVDPDLEASTITYMNGKEVGGPTLLFENIKGHSGYRQLFNPFGSSLNRVAITIREELGKDPIEYVRILSKKMKQRIAPKTIDAKLAPVNQNIESGDKVDVTKFPAPKMWPLDGGKYIGTADAVITQDPTNDRVNLGTFRQMIQGPKQVGFYASPGKDAVLDRERWWAMGKPAPVAAVYGMDPLLFLCAATSFPKDVSEYEFAGGINGAPIEVFKSEVTGLLLPANAEIIIEGFSYPDKTAEEGPFGEFTGYYGRPGGPTPYIDIKTIRYRNKPILTSALMADFPSNECGTMWAMAKAAKVWTDLDALGVPGIKGVWSPPEAAGWGMTVVSIEQRYAGHAAQVGALAAQCMGGAYFTKYIVVVDDDVDPSSLSEVVWAMVTRSRPAQSIEILRETWSTYLDPSQNPPEIRPWGSKCIINACKEFKYLNVFSPRNLLKKEMYETVCDRWKELGFEGAPPKIKNFEPFAGQHIG
ncbi:MAG: UbiD family decarboxylase [Desulfuromonadaceae bacterium]|nr:UbiD family decarboxylase [Desulfuromonadaceae bacterium]